MGVAQSFVDNLENLRIVMSVALEHVQANRGEFAELATANQLRQCAITIGQSRTFAEQLMREFDSLEPAIANLQVIRLHEINSKAANS
jgi:hypothetical protein